MINKNELTKELAEAVIENNEFYEIKLSCFECQNIEDDQYTCTTCWGQGGNIEHKSEIVLKAAFKLKYNKNEDNEFTIEEIKNLVENNDLNNSCKWLFFDEYGDLLKHGEDEDPEYPSTYRTLDIETLFLFLLDNNQK